jgi:hypothetical protein
MSPGARAYAAYARALRIDRDWSLLSHEECLAWRLAADEARRSAKLPHGDRPREH